MPELRFERLPDLLFDRLEVEVLLVRVDGLVRLVGTVPVLAALLVAGARLRRLVLEEHDEATGELATGVVALAESLKVGFTALGISANAQLAAEEGEEEEEIGGFAWAMTIVFSLALAIGLFFVIPVGLTSLFKDQLGSAVVFWLVEGVLRTLIFLGYIVLISRLKDLRRVFEYHGAEHKTISCYEAEDRLVPERAALYSRLHPRCGTSFLLIVMVLAIFVFAPIGLPAWYWLLLSRILGVPLIAGLSYEVIKWAGRNRDKAWVRGVMWPGLMLQNLTTREPDEEQLEVAIAALESVLELERPEDDAKLEPIEIVA